MTNTQQFTPPICAGYILRNAARVIARTHFLPYQTRRTMQFLTLSRVKNSMVRLSIYSH